MHTRRSLAYIFIFLCLCVGCRNIAAQPATGSISELLSRYNEMSVPYISVQALKRDFDQYVILDTRTREEYEVSHLPNAIWVGEDYDEAYFPRLEKEMPIVVYCSIGIRSESFGEDLIEVGYKRVKNLYGSIFAWKDAGYEVFDNKDQPTDRVHVYSKKWGKYLKSGIKVKD